MVTEDHKIIGMLNFNTLPHRNLLHLRKAAFDYPGVTVYPSPVTFLMSLFVITCLYTESIIFDDMEAIKNGEISMSVSLPRRTF